MNHPFSYIFTIIALFVCIPFSILGNEGQDSTLVDHIENSSNGRVKIYQSGVLGSRLKFESVEPAKETHHSGKYTMVGYRIQIFSDNNHSTAKNEALVKERNVIARFPTLASYLTYKAPTWRLRVGDFRTQEEAVEVAKEIKRAFPTYAREITIVRDRVTINN